MLEHGLADLHAAGLAHRRMRHIPVTADLIGGVHDDHALGLGEDTGRLAQEGRLANARPAEQEDGFARFDDVLDDIDGAVDGTADAQGEAHHRAAPVADGRDAMQGALNAGAVVGVKFAGTLIHEIDLGAGDLVPAEDHLSIHVTGSGHAPQVQDDLQQVIAVVGLFDRAADIFRKHRKQGFQVVCDL